jgi:hypothetical protein
MFSKIKISGWAFGEKLESAQMNQLDTDHAAAIDSVGGGDYTLGADLNLIGSFHFSQIDLTLPLVLFKGTSWTATLAGGPGTSAYGYESAGIGIQIVFSLAIPQHANGACKITGAKVHYRPAGGHGDLPQFLPILTLLRQSASGTAVTTIAEQTAATPGSVGEYEGGGTIEVAASHVITGQETYYVRFTTEAGTNAAGGLLLTRIACTIAPL